MQAIAELFESSSEEVEVLAAAHRASHPSAVQRPEDGKLPIQVAQQPSARSQLPTAQPSEEGELPMENQPANVRQPAGEPSEEGELPCEQDQSPEPAPSATTAPAASASMATTATAGTAGPPRRQLSHTEQRVLAFFQASQGCFVA